MLLSYFPPQHIHKALITRIQQITSVSLLIYFAYSLFSFPLEHRKQALAHTNGARQEQKNPHKA